MCCWTPLVTFHLCYDIFIFKISIWFLYFLNVQLTVSIFWGIVFLITFHVFCSWFSSLLRYFKDNLSVVDLCCLVMKYLDFSKGNFYSFLFCFKNLMLLYMCTHCDFQLKIEHFEYYKMKCLKIRVAGICCHSLLCIIVFCLFTDFPYLFL